METTSEITTQPAATGLSETLTEVKRWAETVTVLETKLDELKRQHDELESERRPLLAEKAIGNVAVEERLRTIKAELDENERENEEVRLTLPEARQRLVAAKENRKAAAINEMKKMLATLEAERSKKIEKAKRSYEYEDVLSGYTVHRQTYALANDLYTLTREPRFGGHWGLGVFGASLDREVSMIHNEHRWGRRKIEKPWENLLQIANSN